MSGRLRRAFFKAATIGVACLALLLYLSTRAESQTVDPERVVKERLEVFKRAVSSCPVIHLEVCSRHAAFIFGLAESAAEWEKGNIPAARALLAVTSFHMRPNNAGEEKLYMETARQLQASPANAARLKEIYRRNLDNFPSRTW